MYSDSLLKFIPPEFDLDKYSKAANMELVDWLANLMARALGYLASEEVFENLNELQRELIHQQTRANIQNGVHLSHKYEELLIQMMSRDEAEYSSVVRDITYFDLSRISDSLLTDEYQSLYSNIDHPILPLLNQDSLGALNQKIEIPSLDEENLTWLEVDMNCSDNEILADFKSWLKRARSNSDGLSKSRERKLKTFSKASLSNWHLAKVLPFIDLVTWNKLQGNKVSYKVYGEILYPDPKDLTDKTGKVENTVIPHVTKLMSIETLRRMTKVLFSENRKKFTEKSS